MYFALVFSGLGSLFYPNTKPGILGFGLWKGFQGVVCLYSIGHNTMLLYNMQHWNQFKCTFAFFQHLLSFHVVLLSVISRDDRTGLIQKETGMVQCKDFL